MSIMMKAVQIASCLLLGLVVTHATFAAASNDGPVPSSNYALILSSSRYWFNYRHVANALTIYQMLKTNGFDDDHIVLMLADEILINDRNPFKNEIYVNGKTGQSLMTPDTEIDYRGEDVTVDNLRKALMGIGKRSLHNTTDANVLMYWTGHGGDSFFKFQDVEEITAKDIANLVDEMDFANLLFIADTCQAFTLGDAIDTPNVFMIGSSLRNENSYAHHSDVELGLSVIERWTHRFSQVMARQQSFSITLQQALVDPFVYREQRANVGVKVTTGSSRGVNDVRLSEFFSPVEKKQTTRTKLVPKPQGAVSFEALATYA